MLDREMKKYRDEQFEFTVRDVTFFDKANEEWEQDQQGVVVEEVTPGSWAALGGLNVGDLIVQAADASIGTVEEMEQAMDIQTSLKPQAVVFKVLRGIYTVYLEFEPEWEEN